MKNLFIYKKVHTWFVLEIFIHKAASIKSNVSETPSVLPEKSYLNLEKPTIKYSIVDQAGLPGPHSIFKQKLTYFFDFLKWILLRMLNDHCKCSSL